MTTPLQRVQQEIQDEMTILAENYRAKLMASYEDKAEMDRLSTLYQQETLAISESNQERLVAATRGEYIPRSAGPVTDVASPAATAVSLPASASVADGLSSWEEILKSKDIAGDNLSHVLAIIEEQQLEPDQLDDIDAELLSAIGVRQDVINMWFAAETSSPWLDFLQAAGVKPLDAAEAAKTLDENAIEPDQMEDMDLAALKMVGVKVGVALRMIKHYKTTL